MYYDRLNDPQYGLRALERLGLVKKFILSFAYAPVLPSLNKRKWEEFLLRIVEMCVHQLDEFLVKDDEWSEPVWEIGKGIRIFLEEIGFKQIATPAAKIFMCVLEFDNAYRYRAQDLIGEYRLKEPPRKEIKRLLELLNKRDLPEKGWSTYGKFKKLITPILWLLLIPKFKRAFKKAIEAVDLNKVRFDNNDRFHFAFWRGYDYEGKTWAERYEPYAEIYKNAPFRKKENPYETAKFLLGE